MIMVFVSADLSILDRIHKMNRILSILGIL